MRSRLLLSFLLITAPGLCQVVTSDAGPTLKGYVTRFVSPTDFDVNARRIITDKNTTVLVEQSGSGVNELAGSNLASNKLRLGVALEVYGKPDKKTHAINAWEIRIRQRKPEVSGLAVIEAVLPASGERSSSDKLLRADGYVIRITPETKTKFTAPLTSLADLQANVVMQYEGSQQVDGPVLAKNITLYKNAISDGMKKKRQDWDYDPHVVPSDSHQSGLSKQFRGIDASMFPLHRDAAVQERLNTIGGKLIPAYQRNLPVDDDTRINFRFYLVDAPKMRDTFALPSGIILVPYQVVERVQNDSQLAAVLADKIAALMEQQPIPLPATNSQLALTYGAMAIADTVPFASLPYDAVTIPMWISGKNQFHRNQEQRERVTLSLLHEAGFDLTEAPKAWWLLSSKQTKDLAETTPPETSLYMYEQLGTVWANQP